MTELVPEDSMAPGRPALDGAERESLKQEIAETLRAELSQGRKDFFQHPFFLLVIGFILTGIVGSWLTSLWKSREWENQQLHLSRQKAIEQKYAVIDKLTRAVAEAYIAVEDILHLAEFGWYDRAPDEKAPERATKWSQASRAWRLNTEVLRLNIETDFKNPEAIIVFEEIDNDWSLVSNDTVFIRDALKAKGWAKIEAGDTSEGQDVYKRKDEARQTLSQMSKRTRDLTKLLLEEIQEEIRAPEADPR
ncbi:MAG: hypothetical protein M3416_16270 [Acidobacteriota bacterium]|nr:hypothetical protein [Acidobacteriota bacterium]